MKTSMSSVSISPVVSRSGQYGVSRWATGPASTPAKGLRCSGSFPSSAVGSAQLLQVTFTPGSLEGGVGYAVHSSWPSTGPTGTANKIAGVV